MTDLEGQVLWVNSALSDLTGYTAGELVGRDFAVVRADFKDVLKPPSQGDAWQSTALWRRREGGLYRVHEAVSPLRDAAGRVTHCLCLIAAQTADARQAAEAGFAKAFDASPAALALTAADGAGPHKLVRINDAFVALTGYRRAEAVGRIVTELGLWLDEQTRAAVAAGQLGLKPGGTEVRLRRKDGAVRAGLLACGLTVLDGRQMAIHSILDITERKRAERYYKILLNSVFDAVFICKLEPDGHSSFIDANDRASELLGYSRDELLALTTAQVTAPGNPPLGRAVALTRFAGGGPIRRQTTLLSKQGRHIPVEMNVQSLDVGGVPLMIASIRDLSQQREAERKSRATFDGALEGILRTSLDGNPLDVNPAFARILGYDSVQDYLGHVAAAARAGITDLFCKGLGETRTVRGHEMPIRRKDGSQTWVSFSCQLVYGIDGHPLYNEGLLLDISERKRAAEEAASLEASLRQSQKLEGVGHLAGGIAHEFNNILTVINGYAGFLVDQLKVDQLKATGTLHSYAEMIKASGERAVILTRQLLAFSRKQTFRPRPMNINAAIRGFTVMLEPLISETILVTVELDDTLSEIVADPDQLAHVLMNLALNARDAMPTGGRLKIATRKVQLSAAISRAAPELQPGMYVRITVSDTGHGMSADVRQQIFEPFFTTKPAGDGTGLGLSVVYGIVRQSGGWIDVDSEPEVGTTVTVYLPDRCVEAAPAAVDPIPGSPSAGETVLLVEDQQSVRIYTRTALEDLGYHVLEAAGGTQAIGLAQQHEGPIHLLLTDVILHGMDGRQVAERLVRLRPGLKVVYMSGYPRDVMGPLQGPEAVAFLHKPYGPGELAATLGQLLRPLI